MLGGYALLFLALATGVSSSLQKRDGTGGHVRESTFQSASGHSYTEPTSSYDQPSHFTGHEITSYGSEGPVLPDLTPLIVALLVLTGLSLLFPTYVSVDRRKRALESKGLIIAQSLARLYLPAIFCIQ